MFLPFFIDQKNIKKNEKEKKIYYCYYISKKNFHECMRDYDKDQLK